MNKTFFSVICPAYNAERSIENAINSVLNINYSKFELIIVDDGSTDSTLDICNSFGVIKNIKIIHQQNQGQMMARLEGVKQAEGDYILFLDSDDTLDKSIMSVLDNEIMDFDAVIFNADWIGNNGKTKRLPLIDKEMVLENMDATKYLFYENLFGYLWMYCFKKSFLLNCANTTKNGKKIRYTEDLLFLFGLFKETAKIKLITNHLYFYFNQETSITNSLDKKDKFDRIYTFCNVFCDNAKFLSYENFLIAFGALDSYLRACANASFTRFKKDVKKLEVKKLSMLFKNNLHKFSKYIRLVVLLVNSNMYFGLYVLIKKINGGGKNE